MVLTITDSNAHSGFVLNDGLIHNHIKSYTTKIT